tara:strand:+ start:10895 stop:12124 length:1230 start_codon:yes stop_codon:yes gene_type:complete
MNLAVLSFNGHDTGVSFICEGKHYETILEERCSGIKEDEYPFRIFEHIQKVDDKYPLDKIISINGTDTQFQYSDTILEKYFHDIGSDKETIEIDYESEEHHLYHAASGFYSSGLDEAVCLVMDGWGADVRMLDLLEFVGMDKNLSKEDLDEVKQLDSYKFLETTSIYDASYPCNFKVLYKNYLRPHPPPEIYLEKNDFPYKFLNELEKYPIITCNSCYDVGMLYGLISAHLFGNTEFCGKVMGLSSYGKPNKRLPKFIIENGYVDMNFAFSEMCVNTVNFPSMIHNDDFQHRADIAYKVQKHTEDIFRMKVKQILKLKPDVKNVILSGGVALNICANSIIQEEYPDINFYVDPISSDGCQSYGAAKYFYYKDTKSMIKDPLYTTYYGNHQPDPRILQKRIELEVAKHMC